MLDLSYYVGDGEFVFYDSLSGLYFSNRYTNSIVVSMGWDTECNNNITNNSYFVHGYKITELLKLLNDKVSDSHLLNLMVMANMFKSIGLDNIWVVPVDGEVLDFSDCVRLDDIV